MIPKIIHASWKSKDILNDNTELINRGLKSLVELNPDWELQLSDNDDVERYLSENLDVFDFALLKPRHIVEKLDVWRLIKLYNEGGLYTDIDRFYNLPLSDILAPGIKLVLPTCLDHDFTHDFMLSEPNNPIYATALKLNLERRKEGHDNIYYLGAQTYMHAVTKCLVNEMINTNPGEKIMNALREVMVQSKFIVTRKEEPPIRNILFICDKTPLEEHERMKREFYSKYKMKHWSGQW